MNIALVGSESFLHECQDKLGHQHTYQKVEKAVEPIQAEVIFCDDVERLGITASLAIPTFIHTVDTTLADLNNRFHIQSPVFGFCAWQGFFNRTPIEISLLNELDKPRLEQLSNQLNLSTLIVKDQLGLIAPRVLAMIINEAYETLKQGVASREDIDLSMKLGTNYPYGPFEWCEKIGIEKVRKLLIVLAKTDSRFKPNF